MRRVAAIILLIPWSLVLGPWLARWSIGFRALPPPPSPPPPPPPARRKRLAPDLSTNPNVTAIVAAALSGCKACARAPPLPNASVGWWTPAIAAAEAKAKAAAEAATAAALVAAAAAVRAAIPLKASAAFNGERIPIGQRVRIQWNDHIVHLGTIASHKPDPDAPAGKVLHCISYDIGLEACNNLDQMRKEGIESEDSNRRQCTCARCAS